jgi:hypothetical protein
MRPVTINPNNVQASLIEIQRASQQNDIGDIANSFSTDTAPTQTTQLVVSSPTLANVVAVLGTLLQTMQKGGINRTT